MWTRALAIAAAALFLAPFAYLISPALGAALVLVAGMGCAWAFATGLLPRLRRADAYDLHELRRVHEEEELRGLDPEAALGLPERVVCPRCFTEYPHRAGACPNCGAGG